MEPRMDFDIGQIGMIARKTEAAAFDLAHRASRFDGFLYLERGVATFTDGAGRAYPMHDGSLVFFQRGDAYRLEGNAGCAYIIAVFTVFRDSGNALALLPRIVRADAAVASTLARLVREWEARRPESYMRSRILLLSLYTDLLTADGGVRDPAVLRLLDFIRASFRRPFTAEELAAISSLSPSSFRRRFREAMGMSITEYRDTLRMEAACEMLGSRAYTPKEVARELGYTDVHHFTKVFAAKIGIPPAHYAAGHGA